MEILIDFFFLFVICHGVFFPLLFLSLSRVDTNVENVYIFSLYVKTKTVGVELENKRRSGNGKKKKPTVLLPMRLK